MTTERTNDADEAQGATQAGDEAMRTSGEWSTGTALDVDDTTAAATGGAEPLAGTTGSDWAAGGASTADYRAGADYSTASTVAGTAYGSTGAGGDRLTEAASSVAERAGGTVEMAASQGMTKAAETLGEVAQAVRQSGEQLRDQQPQVASFVDTAAEQLERASSYLRESDLQDIVYRVEDVARRQPMLFIGGAFVLGLAAARFLKSSAAGSQGWSTGSSFRDMGYGVGATGYGAGAGYTSRTADYTGTDDYARTTGRYGSRR